MNRREFLKDTLAAAGAAALASCTGSAPKSVKSGEALGEMTYRSDARFGDRVSILGYGCMRWPKVAGGENDRNAPLDQDQINALVDRAIEAGVNYFDTAPVYCQGKSERATGIALRRHDRSKWLIATKLSNFDPSTWSREASIAIYENSFKELGVDVIDYYVLHSVGGSEENFEARYLKNGVLDFLIGERAKGRIRHLGFSFHGGAKMMDYMLSFHDKVNWDFAIIQMNYVDWNYAHITNPRIAESKALYDKLAERGIPVNIMEPLLGGRLAKLPQRVSDQLQAREPSRSIASWAFRFCGTFPGVMTVLSGMTYMEHLEDNLKSFCPLVPLTEDELAYLDNAANALAHYPTIPCNDCAYCMPCPYGIDIPGIIQHYNRCVNEGNVAVDSGDPEYRRLRRNYLKSYAKAVVPERQADKCIGCSACVDKCPQRINIPRELRKIDIYVEKLRRDE